MRSPFSWLARRRSSGPAHDAAGRPEALRRRTLGTNAWLILLASGLALPPALYGLLQGLLLPFVLCMLGLAAGFLSLALHRRGAHDQAAAAQVYAMSTAGVLLAAVDPTLVDFGLATALVAPVHASLLARAPVRRLSWLAALVALAVAGLAATGMLVPLVAVQPVDLLVAGLVFAVSALLVAHSANRLDSIFEVHERSQINAFRHLIENVQDAVLRLAGSGEVLFASRSAETLFGCPRFVLSGTGLFERVHVLDRPAWLTAFAAASRDGENRRIELRMRRDGDETAASASFVWVEIGLSPVIDPAGGEREHEVVALLRDVTERRDHQNAIEEARKLAEEASNAKSRFLATIGHELRTPLNAIVGFSEMMTSGVVGEMAPVHKEYAGLIHKSGTHLIEVVRMLLDMSRIEAGKFELQAEPFHPEALLEPCLSMVETMAREKEVRIETSVAARLPLLTADERACRQILINLLSNAIKFSDRQSEVTVILKRDGQHLLLTVADRGIGMDSASVRRIGEPFFQAQDGFARRFEGTGLGLSIVKGLVDLHQGALDVASTPGQGTAITIRLPINGPATKLDDTAAVTPLHRHPVPQHMPAWPDEKRRAL